MLASGKVSPHQVAAFNHAARERSFSKAAKVLNVTQSAITQHISNLEKIIGSRLFIRRRSGLELTPAGENMFAISDRIRVLEQLFEERIKEYSSMDAGQLNIVANAPSPAMGLIAEFKKQYPLIQVNFSLGVWQETMEMLKGREIDVGIVTEPEDIDGLYQVELEQTRYVALMLKKHRWARRKSLRMEELANELVILPAEGSLTRTEFLTRMAELDLSPQSIMTVSTFPLSKEAVLHDIGIAIILEGAYSPSDRLVSVPISNMTKKYRNYIVCPSDKKELRLVRHFLELSQGW